MVFASFAFSVKICKNILSRGAVFLFCAKSRLIFSTYPANFSLWESLGFSTFSTGFSTEALSKNRLLSRFHGGVTKFSTASLWIVWKSTPQSAALPIDKNVSEKSPFSVFHDPKTNKFSVTLNERFYVTHRM